jgi:hypothetical protein
MNKKNICVAIFLLIVCFIVIKYIIPKYHVIPKNINTFESNAILPPDYYLNPAFNHIRPVRQRGEYFYFPQLSR